MTKTDGTKLTPEEQEELDRLEDEEVNGHPHGYDCCCSDCDRMRELGSIFKTGKHPREQ